jgi:glycine hydroxymethyltransferase
MTEERVYSKEEELQLLINEEKERLNGEIELIASENYPSQKILDILGSVCSVKYSEGYPLSVSKQGRHYAGCEVVDKIEEMAIENACELFNCKYANVQPWSGSQANLAVYAGFLNPGDTILAMDLNAGGHLTHGSKASASGKIYNTVHYGLTEDGYLNYDEIEEKLYKYNPKMLIIGASAYPRIIDFKKIRTILNKYNEDKPTIMEEEFTDIESRSITTWTKTIDKCLMMVDMAHIAGLVATNHHPSPLPYADVVTTTTHKTLRGPRGGLILWNNEEYCGKINSGVFPKTQGGSNQAAIAAKCQCFIEAQSFEFERYINQVKLNMTEILDGIRSVDVDCKINFVSGGSDNHLALLDIKGTGMFGKEAEELLTANGIICNKNMIVGDKKPSECTGLRIGTAAITTRGFTKEMCYELGRLIANILLRNSKNEPQTEGIVDIEPIIIKTKLEKMLKKVGPFYKNKTTTIKTNPDIIA